MLAMDSSEFGGHLDIKSSGPGKRDKISNELFRLSRASHVKRRKESSRLEVIQRTVARYRFGYSDSSYQPGGCYPH